MRSQSEYVPGVCNIGPAEIRRRRHVGWFGAVLTVVLWGAFFLLRIPAPWRLLLFFPAAMSAVGFLQAVMHFCANFGMRGVFNFGPRVGKTDTVEQAEFRRKDRQKAAQIILYSCLIGITVAGLGFILT
jgi:hypothetical protein